MSIGISNYDYTSNGIKLLDAAMKGRTEDALELLLQDPTIIHLADPAGDTAFHVAACAGQRSTVLEMIEFLQYGHYEILEEVLCDGNVHGDTPLHLALKNGHHRVAVDLALAVKSAVFIENEDEESPSDLAYQVGLDLSREYVHPDNMVTSILKRILAWFLNLFISNHTVIDNVVPLEYGGPEHLPRFTAFPDIGITVSKQKSKIKNAADSEWIKLHNAIKAGKEDVTLSILKDDPNTMERKDKAGSTAVHVAAHNGKMAPLKKMVEFMETNGNGHLKRLLLESDTNNRTPLHLALERGHEKVARHLVKVGPKAVYQVDKQGVSPLRLAIDKGYPDLVRYMTSTDISRPIRDSILEHAKKVSMGHYALALKKRNLATLQAILEGLPDLINVPDKSGWKLLSYAASKGYLNEVNYILKRFPNSTRKIDKDGSYPIHKAIIGGHVSIVKEFLSHCPQSLQDTDYKGHNLVELATLHKKKEVLSFLKDKKISKKN